MELPNQARVVIIGGGVVGCSVAYHLAKMGWSDIVLLERKQLTCGTTWHAAGLIGQLRASMNMTRLAKYSADLYTNLEGETGVASGFKQNGSLALALSEERLEEFARNAAMARRFGVAAEMASVTDCQKMYPWINTDRVVGGIWVPKDGQADPVNIALALAKGARNGGAQIFEDVGVKAVCREGGRVTGVETAYGIITAPIVVNCAGLWGRDVGKMAGVNIPLQAAEHYYAITEPVEGLSRDLPVLRVPDEQVYFKEDAGKFLIGAFEKRAKPWGMDGIPQDFSFDELPVDMDHFMPVLEQAIERVPVLQQTGIATWFNGPESFTPDDRYLLGEAPELKNFFVAAGFNSVGIQSAGGAGMALAEWIVNGAPPFDLWDVDIKRMEPFQNTKSYLVERTKETLGLLYADHFPYRQYETARGIRRSPLHQRLQELGACFGEHAGWERPNWFMSPDLQSAAEPPAYRYSWGRQNWFSHAQSEHLAVRNSVGFFDMSSFAKFRVEGKDAVHVLQLICANNVDVENGGIVYTQWLNEQGGIEADLTVTRLSETVFLIITSAACRVRDFNWLQRHIPEDAHCVVTDVTSGEGVIALMGPRSRELLSQLSGDDLSSEAFPFGTAKTIEVGMVPVRAHRITYVGELGWELYVPTEMTLGVLDDLLEAGQAFGLRPCGMHVLDACRLEKGYRHFGHDVTDEDHVLDAGLGFAVKVGKQPSRFGEFVGRDAVMRRKQEGFQRRLLHFRLSDPLPLLYHNEPISVGDQIVGHVTSGAYGHFLGSSVGMGYVQRKDGQSLADLADQAFDIDIAGQKYSAEASFRPLYDPNNRRPKS